MLPADRIYRKDHSVVSRKIADEYVLVPIRQNVGDLENIYTLDEIATRIWELINGKSTTKKIKKIMVQEFNASPERIEKDLKEFLQKLEKMKLIERK